jgi:beta-phosphoglucomutase-like phosphatase (HAD superfamily)
MAIASPPIQRAVAAPGVRATPDKAAEHHSRLDLDRLAYRWQLALDSAQRALTAESGFLPGNELHDRSARLTQERQAAASTLTTLARVAGVRPEPWLSPVPVTPKMLGLAESVRGCLFDLDGVLTDSGVLHAAAWAEVFDDLLLRVSERADWHFIRFDRVDDYRVYLDGRPRLEGIHAFLASRGIHLPQGRRDDPASAETAYGTARAKSEALARVLERGVTALDGAHRYLQAAGYARLGRAVVSASASTAPMLELSGLLSGTDIYLDADAMRDEELRSRPAPDVLLAACRRLELEPETVVTFTHSAAGVAAGRAAGLTVIGIGNERLRAELADYGADRVAASLAQLLEGRLAAGI